MKVYPDSFLWDSHVDVKIQDDILDPTVFYTEDSAIGRREKEIITTIREVKQRERIFTSN